MTTPYSSITAGKRSKPALWYQLVLVVLLALGSLAAQAQSGPYGNEWIVQGQPYYKLKVWQDGIYRLDYAYLNQLGAGAVAPTQLQLWRRGKEVAVFQGGNAAALDATSYLEFFGQRNDGKLDKEFYKDPVMQANPHYSFYTDTAAYFITWGSRAGKRMAQPTAAGGTPHGWRLQQSLVLRTGTYAEGPTEGSYTYLPWLEGGEGFVEGYIQNASLHQPLDTLLRAVSTAPGAPVPMLETTVVGASRVNHITEIGVIPPGGTTVRKLGSLMYTRFNPGRGVFTLQPGDIGANGSVEVNFMTGAQAAQVRPDAFRYSWWRVTAPQQNVWFANRRQVFFQNDSLVTSAATYEIPNVPATVVGYDVQDPWNVQRVAPTAAQTLSGARYVFPLATGLQTRRLLLADAALPRVPPAARKVTFRAINPVTPNFVIITHPKLMTAGTGTTTGSVPNAARAYANYRASTAGGRYDTLMVTAPQLYDQFHYGERSVIALRHFSLWITANAPATQVKHLLLLGKGLAPGYPVPNALPNYGIGFGQATSLSTRILGEQGLDLVPTTTRSFSDVFLSSDWPHDNLVPAMATGRVPATTSQEVMDYLNKLQDYESQLDPNNPNPDAWHKQAVHLVGGEDVSDFATFGYYMDTFRKRFESPLLAGKVTTFARTTPLSTPIFNIASQTNAGLGLINYFGHGSPTVLDIDFGDVLNPADGYANLHRYPIMIFNGCSVGICFFNTRTISTDWVLAPNKGAIGVMSETGFSYADLLHLAQDTTHRLLYNDPAWFGKPVAEVRREVIRRLQHTPAFAPAPCPTCTTGLAGQEQLLCTLWQGDPALRLFAPAKPDLVVSNATLSLQPIAPDPAITTGSTQFTLNVGVSNPARITRDSVEIRVTRTYNNGSGRAPDVYVFNNHGLKPFPQAFQRDTVYSITLPNPQASNIQGDNIFKVEIDYRNKIAELNETNNTAEIHYSFLRKGLTLLTPSEFAIVPTNTPVLTWQNNDPAAGIRGYDVQIDSTGTFANPIQSYPNVQASVVGTKQPTALVSAPGRYSQVWYWRVRFTNPTAQEDANWQVSSFRVVPGTPSGGWSQSHYNQFGRDLQQTVAQTVPSGRWNFADQLNPVVLSTIGGGLPATGPTFLLSGNYGIRTNLSALPDPSGCGILAPNLLVAVLDPFTLERVTVPGTYSTCGQLDQTFYHFGNSTGAVPDTLDNLNNSAARRTELLTFLGNVPDGSVVVLVSENRLRYTSPALAPVVARLATVLGSNLVTQLKNGSPWALVARKKATGGTLLAELGPDAASIVPAFGQAITLNYSIPTPTQKGRVLSTIIGPAQQWQSLMNTIVREDSAAAATSKYRLTLFGLDASNNATVLLNNIPHTAQSLASYPAATYPYMRLQVTLADTVNRVPPQLKQWLITYKGLPEGIVRRDLVAATPNGVFYDPARQASLAADSGYVRIPVRFENISQVDFAAPLQAQVTILDASKGTVAKYPSGLPVQKTVTILPGSLTAGKAADFWVKLDMIGVFGSFTAQVVVNPQVQPELYYYNNSLTIAPFTVSDTNVPPTLDVAVDGRHILDGELVSPVPVINIQLKDEDKLRHITDASYFTVYLQKGSATPTTVNMTGRQVQFSVDNSNGSVAKLVYQPGLDAPLADGVYTLRVQGKDPSNAKAGTVDYLIKFEVVNASTITNVYPYPNPITSKARFVFTVTGQELPRNMKIQIMTLTGKVVREIFMNELGALHIGNNLTDYAWDGTDQYGDRLANGTYLYRVALDDASSQFTRRATAGDKAFANDWGKLVLLR